MDELKILENEVAAPTRRTMILTPVRVFDPQPSASSYALSAQAACDRYSGLLSVATDSCNRVRVSSAKPAMWDRQLAPKRGGWTYSPYHR